MIYYHFRFYADATTSNSIYGAGGGGGGAGAPGGTGGVGGCPWCAGAHAAR